MMIKKLLFLGPKGSYSDLAKNNFLDFISPDCEFIPEDSIYSIFSVLSNSSDEFLGAVIPIENSIEGVVRESQDSLSKAVLKSFRIFAETTLHIEHSLIGYAKSKDEAKIILSHPQALAQCRDYIHKNFSDSVVLNPVFSTSKAVASLGEKNPYELAIASSYSAQLYDVPILEANINDEKNNTTRFVLLSKSKPKKTENSKVSITFSTVNQAGALNKILSVLEKYGLNMSYIDSRPSRKELGEYVFYIDFSGHIDDVKVHQALVELQQYVNMFELLSMGAICV